MSKREPGCLSFIFGPCYRKRNKQRNAVSVENSGINERIKDIATQTAEQVFRSSAPGSLFPSAHKPIIAVRDSKGFHIQDLPRDRLIIKNDDVRANYINSIGDSEDFESIPSLHNDDPIMSSRSLHRLFSPLSPLSDAKVIPNPFK